MATFTLTELQHADAGEGPWRLYIIGRDGKHTGGRWFRRGPMMYPDEEITAQEAKDRTDLAIRVRLEVRICDGGDELVFHSVNGVVVYPNHPDEFWKAAGL